MNWFVYEVMSSFEMMQVITKTHYCRWINWIIPRTSRLLGGSDYGGFAAGNQWRIIFSANLPYHAQQQQQPQRRTVETRERRKGERWWCKEQWVLVGYYTFSAYGHRKKVPVCVCVSVLNREDLLVFVTLLLYCRSGLGSNVFLQKVITNQEYIVILF